MPDGVTPGDVYPVTAFVCPSEPNNQGKWTTTVTPPTPNSWPSNYGVNLGTWLVWSCDPTGEDHLERAPFVVNLRPTGTRQFTDGKSQQKR